MKQVAEHTLPLETSLTGADFSGDYAMVAVPKSARAAASQALERGQTHYAPVGGIPPLKDAVVEHLRDMGVHTTADRVIVSAGMQEARYLALQGVTPLNTPAMLAARGDRQARFLAVYDAVSEAIRIALPAVADPGVRAVLGIRPRDFTVMPVDAAAGWLPALTDIETALTNGANLIYLESPSRLTGAAYDLPQVRQIAALLVAHNALCVWDQSFAPAVVEGYTSLLAHLPERTLAIGMLWPGMGLSAWQSGYVVAPADMAEAIVALKQVSSICTATVPQWAAVGVSEVYKQEHARLLSELDAARSEAISGFSGDARILRGNTANVIALNLGQQAGHVQHALGDFRVADGAAFGAPGVVRITVKPGAATTQVVRLLLGGVIS